MYCGLQNARKQDPVSRDILLICPYEQRSNFVLYIYIYIHVLENTDICAYIYVHTYIRVFGTPSPMRLHFLAGASSSQCFPSAAGYLGEGVIQA